MARNNVSKMTYFVLSKMQNLNSINSEKVFGKKGYGIIFCLFQLNVMATCHKMMFS